MTKFYILLIILFYSLNVFSQKDTLSITLNYKAKGYNKKESVAISNTKNNELVILIEDKKETTLHLIDKNGNLTDEIKTDRLGLYLVNFLGHHYFEDGTYAIVFSDSRKRKFSALKFNFKTKKVEQVVLDFILNQENYVEGITQNNTFYLMTANKGKSDDVNFYELDTKNSFIKHTVSFGFATIVFPDGYKKRPIHLLTQRGLGDGSLTKIDPHSPSSIKTTSGTNKLYQLKDELVFSFDEEKDATKLISVHTNDFSIDTLKISKPKLDNGNNNFPFTYKHNSYINDSIIYHIVASKKQMKFTAKNIKTKSILKEISLKQEDSITFKNGPIVLEKTGAAAMYSGEERLLEKTSKFLRKVSSSDAGITAINLDGNLQFTIGGYTEVKSGGAPMMMGGGFGPAGFVLGNAAFNPTFFAYNSYASSKLTYINCVFDYEFNHVSTEIKTNVFDEIKDYEDLFAKNNTIDLQQENNSTYTTPARMKLKNVFYHNGSHYLGYINTVDRNYHIVKF